MLKIHAMNFRNLDLNLLRVFDAIHAEGSTTQAAARLGLTQPAVSNALNRLRQQLGDPLFERGPSGMEPTPAARRIAPVLSDALRSLERSLGADQEFDPATSTREFRMIVPEALELMLVHPLLTRAAAMPGITFRLLPVNSPGYKDMVMSREADIAIFPWMSSALRIPTIGSLDPWPNVRRWRAGLEARPAVQRGLAQPKRD